MYADFCNAALGAFSAEDAQSQSQSQRMSLTAGTQLGPYEVVGLIGQGGMGEVYRAGDTSVLDTAAFAVSTCSPR